VKNSSSTLQSFSYSDAPDGSILSETDVPVSSSASYTYDGKDRLASMTIGSNPALDYGFDASGNLTTLPTGASAAYDHASELTSSSLSGTTTSYAYNADGDQLTATQGATTMSSGTWNGADDATAWTSPAGAMSAASYDGNGVRASATFTPSGGTAATQDYTWNTTGSVPLLLMDSDNAYIYAGGGTPAEQLSLATGTASYLSSDSLGSVRGIISAAGALTTTTSYDAWGNPQTAGGLTADTPFGYAGAYTDPDGLLYLINRYYNPQTGQFTSVDPMVAQTLEP
jgi:RHS repeat-associated protein